MNVAESHWLSGAAEAGAAAATRGVTASAATAMVDFRRRMDMVTLSKIRTPSDRVPVSESDSGAWSGVARSEHSRRPGGEIDLALELTEC
ncbi:hypothetical protein GCM10029976_073940 [Kribbella albertanoniae]